MGMATRNEDEFLIVGGQGTGGELESKFIYASYSSASLKLLSLYTIILYKLIHLKMSVKITFKFCDRCREVQYHFAQMSVSSDPTQGSGSPMCTSRSR